MCCEMQGSRPVDHRERHGCCIPRTPKKRTGSLCGRTHTCMSWIFTGTHLTHPLRPDMLEERARSEASLMEDFSSKNHRDCQDKGEGWIEYMFPKPEEMAKRNHGNYPRNWHMFIGFPERKILVSAGLFDRQLSLKCSSRGRSTATRSVLFVVPVWVRVRRSFPPNSPLFLPVWRGIAIRKRNPASHAGFPFFFRNRVVGQT